MPYEKYYIFTFCNSSKRCSFASKCHFVSGSFSLFILVILSFFSFLKNLRYAEDGLKGNTVDPRTTRV